VRTLMFRFDFFLWALVELFWMGVNLLLIGVIYRHTSSVAGWSKYEMMFLVGTAMLIQRYVMGFFWSNLFEMSRNIRTGNFDFLLAQPATRSSWSRRASSTRTAWQLLRRPGVVIYAGRSFTSTPAPRTWRSMPSCCSADSSFITACS